MTLQPSVLGEPATSWTPCSLPGHLDAVRDLHEDVADRILRLPPGLITVGPYELTGYVEAEALLEHLDGKHLVVDRASEVG